MIITANEMQQVLQQLFIKYNFSVEKATVLAETHTENTLAGVNSHGINRVPAFIQYVKKGLVKVDVEAKKLESFGSLERWDGGYGSGVLNARSCTTRAIALAEQHGMGLVALRHTNHWMRGGAYGWQAAEAGCISIMFTNTQPNMPPWGGVESRIGNNPLIIAIPRQAGHVVMDMALSQYSFGKINEYRLRGEKLPFPGGLDSKNELSNDPEELLKRERGLPNGYWKGSALSMVLDMLATLLSAGDSTYRISTRPEETGISQVFLCIYPALFQDPQISDKLLNEIIDYTHDVPPVETGQCTYYPGEQVLLKRQYNLKHGMQVNDAVWGEVLKLLSEE